MIYNFTNRPEWTWSPEERQAARELSCADPDIGQTRHIYDVGTTYIEPTATAEEVTQTANEVAAAVPYGKACVIFSGGDETFAYALLHALHKRNITCYAPIFKEVSEDVDLPEIASELERMKISKIVAKTNRFVQFRQYRWW